MIGIGEAPAAADRYETRIPYLRKNHPRQKYAVNGSRSIALTKAAPFCTWENEMTATKKSTKSKTNKASNVFSEEERAAMREVIRERRRQSSGKADGESDVLAKIAEMAKPDRMIAERLHAILPRTWYGMPAYAKGDRVICFFQSAQKFKSRYSTFGFQPPAKLDEGDMWATSFAVTRLTPEVEKKIGTLVKKAAS